MSADLIPLPEHLLRCGCPHPEWGQHRTSCKPAREHDAIPLTERDGYADGAGFQGIRWLYPLRLDVRVAVRVEVDPIEFIKQHRLDYETFELERGYAEWEKPMQFLASFIQPGDLDVHLPGGRHVARTEVDVLDIEEYPRWTPDDTAALNEALTPSGIAVHPDQGAFFEPSDGEAVEA